MYNIKKNQICKNKPNKIWNPLLKLQDIDE